MAVLLSGCTFNASVSPDSGVRVRCETESSPCPPGLACRPEVRVCVPTDAERRPPRFTQEPTLTVVNAPQLSPPAARAGTRVEVRFSVDEALDPVLTRVVARLSGQELLFARDEAGSSPTDALYVLEARGDEPEGLARVQVEAIDANGNLAPDPSALSLRLDFTPPRASLATLTLVPGPGNPLREVSAVTSGTTARLLFVMSEPLASPPVVRSEPALVAFTARDAGEGPLVFDGLLVSAALLTAPLALTVEAVDLVGNTLRGPLAAEPPLQVDTEPPLAPQGALYRRAPWGADSTQGVPDFRVLLDGGAGPAGLTVLVTDEGNVELGRALADARGAAEVLLPAVDRPSVRVLAVDGAGNASPSARVGEVEWLATLAGKRPGDLFGNPHRLERVGAFGEGLLRADAEELEGSVLARTDQRREELLAQPSWRQRTWDAPEATSFLGLAWDEARATAVAYGGALASGAVTSDTAEWNQQAWRRVAPEDPEQDGDPPPRSGPALAFDRRRGVTVLYGGQAITPLEDLWEWNGRSWRRVQPSGGPGPRTRATLVTDGEGVLLIGGGPTSELSTGDLWRWDGRRWQGFDAGMSPRRRPAAAWDPDTNQVLVYGGFDVSDGGSTTLSDTWAFDGASASLLLAGGAGPVLRSPAMVKAPRGPLVLFGAGAGNRLQAFGWSGAQWTPLTLGGDYPFVSAGLAAVWDAPGERALLELGLPDAGHQTLWWSTDGGVRVASAGALPSPSRRREHAMAYQPSGVSVLFGGSGTLTSGPPTALGDTWAYDGQRWQRLALAAEPSARLSASLTWDSARLVLLGGSADVVGSAPAFNDVHHFDGAQWLSQSPATLGPAPFANAAASWAGPLGLVLYGGATPSGVSGASWRWTGDWQPFVAPGPSRLTHVMGYHPARQLLFVYGGISGGASSTTSQVLALGADGGWQQVGTAPLPSRSNATVAYDSSRGDFVFFGGVQFSGSAAATVMLADTWAWSGELDGGLDFRLLTPSDPEGDGNPGPRNGHTAVFDAARNKVVLFGGGLTVASGVQYADTWELDREQTRPALVAQFNARAIGWPAGATLVSVGARAVAGASARSPAGAPVPGVSLQLWNLGRWEELAVNAAERDAPQSLEALRSDLTRAGAASTLDTLGLAVVPRGRGGPDRAALSVDSLELRVRYRAP